MLSERHALMQQQQQLICHHDLSLIMTVMTLPAAVRHMCQLQLLLFEKLEKALRLKQHNEVRCPIMLLLVPVC